VHCGGGRCERLRNASKLFPLAFSAIDFNALMEIPANEKNGVNRSRTLSRLRSAIVYSLFGSLLCAGCAQQESSPPRPPQVQVVRVVEKDVSIYSEWAATLDGYVNAQIQPQVIGYLIKQDYREGSFVHKNDVPVIPVGLPSELLERRPDIREAEATLMAANAEIGVAKAAYFPSISLTGTAGYESYALNNLFTHSQRMWNGAASVTQPVFAARPCARECGLPKRGNKKCCSPISKRS
jgi:hypothetical protein